MSTGVQEFSRQWHIETRGTLALMRALPPDCYEFRPDPGGRSIGELAWHLAEVDGYGTFGIERGSFIFDKPPNMQRLRCIGIVGAAEAISQAMVLRRTSEAKAIDTLAAMITRAIRP